MPDAGARFPTTPFRPARALSGPHVQTIAGIRVPTLVVHSRDDPFLPAAAIPEAAPASNPAITAVITDRGGHQGYVAGSVLRPRFWVEAVVAAFLEDRLVPGASRPAPG